MYLKQRKASDLSGSINDMSTVSNVSVINESSSCVKQDFSRGFLELGAQSLATQQSFFLTSGKSS
jgi:hypothetical protein